MTTAPSFTTLKISTEGAVGRLTLDRPEKLNPLSWQCFAEIIVIDSCRWGQLTAGEGRCNHYPTDKAFLS